MKAKKKTRASIETVLSGVTKREATVASIPRIAAHATARPTTPPSTDSTKLSAMNCRIKWPRLAPNEVRIAISRSLAIPLVKVRLARFAQAMSRTIPTADIMT